mgnify:CR=1 FL=1
MPVLLPLLALLTEPCVIGSEEADRTRIQRHLQVVESELRARDVRYLSSALQAERRRNLDRLQAYRRAGLFPRNDDYPDERVPYFFDDDGVACAVGHLVVESGYTTVAEEIHARENNARLLDMTHPALSAWITASGLTGEECARIQPSYCECDHTYEPVCGVDENTYLNACVATVCADVEIAHTGVCAGASTTDWPNAGTSTTATTTGATDTDATAGDPPTEASAGSSTDGSDPRTATGGCRVGDPAPSAFVLLTLLPRRRTRS